MNRYATKEANHGRGVLVALLTDFGWDDPYLAELKAALFRQWARYPELNTLPAVVDISHTISPYDVAAAHWLLGRVHGEFPPGSVHVAVVDPGVGTSRPVVAARAGGQFFVAPGNGLLSFLSTREDLLVVRLDKAVLHRQRGGAGPAATFQGRDIMAPVAAHLALGMPLDQVGSPGHADDLGQLSPAAVASFSTNELGSSVGRVVWIDRFGNAVTDVARDSKTGKELAAGAVLQFGQVAVEGPRLTFGTAAADQPFWYWGSGGFLEAALPHGNGAATYGWRRGLTVTHLSP